MLRGAGLRAARCVLQCRGRPSEVPVHTSLHASVFSQAFFPCRRRTSGKAFGRMFMSVNVGLCAQVASETLESHAHKAGHRQAQNENVVLALTMRVLAGDSFCTWREHVSSSVACSACQGCCKFRRRDFTHLLKGFLSAATSCTKATMPQ